MAQHLSSADLSQQRTESTERSFNSSLRGIKRLVETTDSEWKVLPGLLAL